MENGSADLLYFYLAFRVTTPHYGPGVLLEKNTIYTKVYAKLGLSVMWNAEDGVSVRAFIEPYCTAPFPYWTAQFLQSPAGQPLCLQSPIGQPFPLQSPIG